MAVVLLAHRGFQRDRLLRYAHDLLNLLRGDVQPFCDLRRGRVAAEILHQFMRRTRDAVDCLDHMHGNADGSGVVGNGAGDGLPDPPRRVGGEFIALGIVKFPDRLDEAKIALLNKVEQRQATADIALRDGYDKAQIRLDHRIVRRFIALGEAFGDLRLLLARQERDLADLLEVHPHGIVQAHHLGHFLGVDELFLLDQLQILLARCHVVGLGEHFDDVRHVDFDPGRLQRVIDHICLALVGVDGIQRIDQIL